MTRWQKQASWVGIIELHGIDNNFVKALFSFNAYGFIEEFIWKIKKISSLVTNELSVQVKARVLCERQ